MTLDEATVVANIMATADHGCSTCVGDLLDRFEKAFPEFCFELTDEEIRELPEWFDPEDDDPTDPNNTMQTVGYRVAVTLREPTNQ